MANVIRKWNRVIAVSCTHGSFLEPRIAKQVLQFAERYKPKYRFHLGDVLDTAAFRAGAQGTPDEGQDVGVDQRAGIRFIEDYRPSHLAWGNHDNRLPKLMGHPNAIVSGLATLCWNELETLCRKMRIQTVEYDLDRGWFDLGGTYWGHGYWFNENAVRDHAEYLGGPCVIGHLHRPHEVSGRTRVWTPSFCVGMLADAYKMKYARARRATSQWGHGLLFGEVCQNESRLWLAKCPPGGNLHFPL